LLIAISYSLATCEAQTVETAATKTQIAEVESCTNLNFRFVTVSDTPYSSTVQQVEIFLEEKSFNEANLKELLAYISRQHPTTPILLADVKTSWEQLSPITGDCPGSGSSENRPRKDEYDYHQARYRRSEDSEYFEYSKALRDPDFKRVRLR
jgi:hypothetical protein